jgi:hypothetical protein
MSSPPTRRRLLTQLATTTLATAASLIAPVTHARPSRAAGSIELLDCTIAGFSYHAGYALWPQLVPGRRVDLVREPDNRHDPDAVALFVDGQRIGYIPRQANTALARRLDAHHPTRAAITHRDDSAAPWECLRVTVWGDWVMG